MTKRKRILFGASYSVIEPLGLLYLAGLARDEDWERQIHLVKDHDFEHFFEKVRDYKPDIVGFNVYTGNHIQLFDAFKRLKKEFPSLVTIVGGPHPTYFPSDASQHADYVVMSEGFGALRKILRGEVTSGILPMEKTERFPHPDRVTFYQDYPCHAQSRIKSLITMTGCPYSCTYCYNSSTPADIRDSVPLSILGQLEKSQGMGGRLFPHNVRSVDDVIREGVEIREKWPTEVIYSQDDVHGFDTRHWMVDFAHRWPKEVGIPYHAQMRWEMTKEKKRLDLLVEAGCFGLTLAIEAADPVIRREVLDRAMPEELMFNGMTSLVERGFKIRTEQITGLPYGATTQETPINLDADLELIKLNVRLKKETGGPTMAWASTLAPYKGTKLEAYCEQFGHYIGNNNDVPDTFFERSVLKFPKQWIGVDLEKRKYDRSVWLSPDDLERYRDQNAELRRLFNFFTLVPEGDTLAESYLNNRGPFGYERLGKETEEHLYHLIKNNNFEAARLLQQINELKNKTSFFTQNPVEEEVLKPLIPYFGCLPLGEIATLRFLRYSREHGSFTPRILSDATRHHLYDECLYSLNTRNISQPYYEEHLRESSRTISKA